jgi:nitroimidazol reductase NimA-like FMN-containing flavoprotein (pyridoxamine 5'-phosphate oxidase superfamily)
MRRSDREVSEPRAIEEIFSKADVCRIALANDNIPYIVTMNFGYEGFPVQCIYFHCAGEGRKLEMISKNNYVCFEIDTDHRLYKGKKGCDWGMKYKSIVGYGNISVITEKEAKIAGLNRIMFHYGGNSEYFYSDSILEKTTILRLDILEMTGKRK